MLKKESGLSYIVIVIIVMIIVGVIAFFAVFSPNSLKKINNSSDVRQL